MCKERCYGNEFKVTHVPGCRPGRPLCKWQRSKQDKYRVCNCPAYAFPHRLGSGRCGHPEQAWKEIYGDEDRQEQDHEWTDGRFDLLFGDSDLGQVHQP